jgi:hypothetical protein
MRQFTALCAILAMAVSTAKSEDRPRPFLKNVSLVVYDLGVEPPNKGLCAIDYEAWNTAMDFVANQLTKPKLIKEAEHSKRERELLDKSNEASRKYLALQFSSDTPAVAARKAWEEAREIHSKYSAAPRLSLIVETLEQKAGCFGTLSGSVTAMLTSSEMISTGKAVGYHSWEIWSSSKLLASPPNEFSSFVIQSSEEMMKSFVNDWALTQREYKD